MYLYPHRRHKRISNKHISDFLSVYFGFILGLVFPRHVLLQAGICTKVCTKPCSDTRLALRRGGQVAVIAAIHDRGVVSAPAAIVVGNAVGRWVALALTYGCHYLSDEGDEKVRAALTPPPPGPSCLFSNTSQFPARFWTSAPKTDGFQDAVSVRFGSQTPGLVCSSVMVYCSTSQCQGLIECHFWGVSNVRGVLFICPTSPLL